MALREEVIEADLRRVIRMRGVDDHVLAKGQPRQKAKWRRNPLPTQHRVLLCPATCGRCVGETASGDRCRRRTCVDYRFCWYHLMTMRKLLVARSRVPARGMGLYAIHSAAEFNRLKREVRRDSSSPPRRSTQIVFRRGDVIDRYYGELLTPAQLNERYRDRRHRETVMYGITVGNKRIDALCAPCAVSYANDAVDVAELYESNPADFEAAYDAALRAEPGYNAELVEDAVNKKVLLQAKKTIRHGDEILTSYDANYWSTEGVASLFA